MCAHVYNALMVSIRAYKYAGESKTNAGALRRHRQVAFPRRLSWKSILSGFQVPAHLRRAIAHGYRAGFQSVNLKESGT